MKKLLILGMIGGLFLCDSVMAQEKITEEEFFFTEIPGVFAAAKFEQKIEEAPAPVTIIIAEEIKRSGYSNLSEALRGIAGLYITYNRSYEELGVRGYFIPGDVATHVLILINGLSINDPMYGSGPTGNELCIDIDSIKRIEVIKGPGSALYGAHAVFCVINIITKDGTDINGLKVTGNYGSYQSKKGGFRYGKIFDNGLETFISANSMNSEGQDLYFPEYDTPETNNGVFENGDKEKYYNLFTKLVYENMSFQAGINEREKRIPTGAYKTVFNDPRTRGIDMTNFVELKYTKDLDKNKDILARIYHCQYAYDGDWISYGTPTSSIADLVDWARANWLGSEIQFNWETSAKNRLTLGGEYQNQYRIHQRNYTKGISNPNYYKENLNDKRKLWFGAFYLQDIWKVKENLSLTLGGRIDHYSNFGKTINPRIAIVYNPEKTTTLKLLYGSAFRAPTSAELYYHDGNYSVMANPDLKPEELKTYEFVCEQRINKDIRGILSLYRTNLCHIISSVEISPDVTQSQNGGKIKAQGIELGIDGIWNKIKFRLSSNFQEAKNKDNKKIVNSPDNSANLRISHPFFNENLYLTTELRSIGKRLTHNDEWLEPYLCTNVTLFSHNLIPNTELTFKINNLFNESYADPCSDNYKQTKISQNGRNYLVKIGYKLW